MMISLTNSLQAFVVIAFCYTTWFQLISFIDNTSSITVRKGLWTLPRNPAVVGIINFPKGELNPSLHKQALSHHSLHRPALQRTLAILCGLPKTVLIVGVEWGGDLSSFADSGYRVIAFEPMPFFYNKLVSSIKSNPKWNVKLFNYAAGNETSKMTLKYQHRKAENPVTVVRIEDHVHEDVSVFSVDVQGGELNVVQGASKLIKKSIKMIWFEAISCNQRVHQLMNLLDDDFVMFDFVPVGNPSSQNYKGWDRRENFMYDPQRPNSFQKYNKWFCDAKSKFTMLQTDILAVRRDIAYDIWPQLDQIANNVCRQEGSNCLLRSLLKI